jgi:hypothetical protein
MPAVSLSGFDGSRPDRAIAVTRREGEMRMMEKRRWWLQSLIVGALCAVPSYAGLTLNITDDPSDSVIVTGSQLIGDTWIVGESFLATGSGVGTLDATGLADEDPVITITKNVVNVSGFDWYGYQVELTGDGTYQYDATASEGGRTYLTAETDTGFTFYGWDPIQPGEELGLSFSLLLPAGGFQFGIDQTPLGARVPVPGALALAGIGAAAIGCLRRRKTL